MRNFRPSDFPFTKELISYIICQILLQKYHNIFFPDGFNRLSKVLQHPFNIVVYVMRVRRGFYFKVTCNTPFGVSFLVLILSCRFGSLQFIKFHIVAKLIKLIIKMGAMAH